MRLPRLPRPATLAALLLVFSVLVSEAFACACCSERGSRIDRSVHLDDPTRHQIGRMVFAKAAVLTSEIGDARPVSMPPGSSSSYELTMTRDKAVMAFAFRDPLGRTGTLRFAVPNRIWMFEVDPFGDAKDEGLGPSLYKEWRLTAPVKGDGIFRRGTIAGQKVTLILHGRGRGCTEAENFSDWPLLLHGPAGSVTFYGALEKL